MFKKLMLIFFSVALAATLAACGDSKDKESTDYGSTVTVLDATGNDVLVYYPKPNAAETLGVKTTCTAPIFMVFGSGAYTQAEAVAYANSSGLAKIAAENGSSVCFVNPQNDASWETADVNAYATVAQIVKDGSDAEVIDGVAHTTNPITHAAELGISGTQQRIYVYAIGAGADFITANALKPMIVPTWWGGTVNVTMSGCTLNGATDASGVLTNDIPVVSIGCTDAVNTILDTQCGSLLKKATADYVSQYNAVIGRHRRQYGVLLPFYNYAELGIVQQVGSTTVTTTADNVTFAGIATTHIVNFVAYWDENLNAYLGNVPLVLCFHGGSNTALYEAQATEWPLIAKENGFVTVSVDLHFPNCTAGEIVQLIDYLKTKYPIDGTRIYATGFSMGSAKSWDLFEQFPAVFAAVSPQDASYAPGVDSFGNPVTAPNTNTLLPVFFVGGEASPLAEMPLQSENVFNRVANLFSVNGVTNTYSYTFANQAGWANPIWAANGDITYQIYDKKAFKDSILTVNMFVSNDGKYYTALANSSNQSHEVYARNSWAAWDFMSQFSRTSTGTISISPVDYELPSEGNTIIDNSYNL